LRLSDRTAVGGGAGAVRSHSPCDRGLFNIVLVDWLFVGVAVSLSSMVVS
jgi:hypothetical protein